MRPIMLQLISCLFSLTVYSQTQIVLPKTNDKYAEFVKQLESGHTNIDYKDFRFSYLEHKYKSDSYIGDYDSLKGEMFKQAHQFKNYNEVINICKKMLSINYTSLYAHKYLRQTYKIVGDTINANKYYTIQMGLLNSITKNGNGKSSDSAWEVIDIEEEYFILYVLGLKFQSQALDDSGKVLCDIMTVVTENGESDVYYFNVEKLMQKQHELFSK